LRLRIAHDRWARNDDEFDRATAMPPCCNPGQGEALSSNPDLIGSAVEELLRYDSPVQKMDELHWQYSNCRKQIEKVNLFASALRQAIEIRTV